MPANRSIKTRNQMAFLVGVHDRALGLFHGMAQREITLAIPNLVEECLRRREEFAPGAASVAQASPPPPYPRGPAEFGPSREAKEAPWDESDLNPAS